MSVQPLGSPLPHLASCAVGTWDLCPVREAAGVWSWPLPCSTEVKECVELILHSPMCIHIVVVHWAQVDLFLYLYSILFITNILSVEYQKLILHDRASWFCRKSLAQWYGRMQGAWPYLCSLPLMSEYYAMNYCASGRQHRGCIIPQAVTHSLVLLKMGKIIFQNVLSWLELLISRYCCI